MKEYSLATIAAICLSGSLLVLQANAQVIEPWPLEVVMLSHHDGRRALCEVIEEDDDSIRVARVASGKQVTVAKHSLGHIKRSVTQDEAIDWVGVADVTAWRVLRSTPMNGNQSPLATAVLPIVGNDGKASMETRRLEQQVIAELRRRKVPIIEEALVADLMESRSTSELLDPNAARQWGQQLSAPRVLQGFIAERRTFRETSLSLIDVATGNTIWSLSHTIRTAGHPTVDAADTDLVTIDAEANVVQFSPTGDQIVSAGNDGHVRFFDARTGSQQFVLQGHGSPIQDLAFSRLGNRLASVGSDGDLKVWDVPQRAPLWSVTAHETVTRSVVLTPDGQLAATGGDDGLIRLWNISQQELLSELSGHTGFVRSLVFVPWEPLLVSASHDRTIKVWNWKTGRVRATLEGHMGYVYQVAFGPTGRMLVSASGDGTARLWDLSRGAEVGSIRPRAGAANSVACASNNRLLATSHANESIMLWNAKTLDQLVTVGGLVGGADQLVFSADASRIAATCGDGRVRVWDVAQLLTLR